ncbi:hypothetical protein A2U01_0084234, partial [Trifolium medium]|nr:hypothetical protein [Trifolium medium]
HEEEPVRKKRSTRRLAHGEGGSSRQQPPQQSQEPEGELSYAEAFMRDYPYMGAAQHSWSNRFYLETCKK